MKRALRRCGCGLAALLLAACGGGAPPPAAPVAAPPPATTAAPAPVDAAAAPGNTAQPPPPDPGRAGARGGSWLRAEAERKRWPIAWEFREDFIPGQRPLPQLAVISLGRNINYSGRRDPVFEHELDQREQSLRAGMGERLVLVAVMDWQLQHDWFGYAEAGVTEADIHAALRKVAGRDVRVTLEPDADAKFYRTLLKRVRGEP
jgi:hypothetical protein